MFWRVPTSGFEVVTYMSKLKGVEGVPKCKFPKGPALSDCYATMNSRKLNQESF